MAANFIVFLGDTMLYRIIEIKRGAETVKMIDSLPKCNNRIKELRSSSRGKAVSFRMEKAEETNKFESKPLSQAWRAGDYAISPPSSK